MVCILMLLAPLFRLLLPRVPMRRYPEWAAMLRGAYG